MPIKKNANRQDLIVAVLDINFADPAAYGTAENAIELPVGAVVSGGDVVITTPFNSTTNTLTLGDVTTANRYANALDLKAAAGTRTALGGLGTQITSTISQIRVNLAQTGGVPTAGAVRVTVQYYVLNRARFTQG
ncbi:MAG: hypothetical protein RJB68_2154 [Pseudomonadota bacterium]|jgi:hypothetical protein